MTGDNLKALIEDMGKFVKEYGSGPTFEKMERRTLSNKGIAGSTAAHFVEEIHTPVNFAYTTFTTGTSAFQNIVGITYEELEERKKAAKHAIVAAGLKKGDIILITYPPLVNVFYNETLKDCGIETRFILRPSRDAFLYSLCSEKPSAVIGESSFIRAALQDGFRLGITSAFPENLAIIVAGTPLDMDLLDTAKKLTGAKIFDLYGNQEFGWLTINGVPLREDISLVPIDKEDKVHLVVGGLATEDIFDIGKKHILGGNCGVVPTYSRLRSDDFWETIVLSTTAKDISTLQRTAKSILRIKGRIVRFLPDVTLGAGENKLALRQSGGKLYEIPTGKTKMFDDILAAQVRYQRTDKNNPIWKKEEH